MENEPLARRQFFKVTAVAVAAIPAVGSALSFCGANAFAGGPLPQGEKALDPNDPMAKALKYVTNGKKSPERTARGAAGATQSCSNCSFFTKKNAGWGKCTVLTAGLVDPAGWCMSYSAKVAT